MVQALTRFTHRLIVMCLIGFLLQGTATEACAPAALVRYGTSFGECMGYCSRSIDVFSTRVTFFASAYHPKRKFPDVRNEVALNKQEQEELGRLLSGTSADGLTEIIGCPDCTDGGAEWIEITTNGRLRRVMFEYVKPPAQLKALRNRLKSLRDRFPVPPVQ